MKYNDSKYILTMDSEIKLDIWGRQRRKALLILREGTRQAEMLAFPFADAREPGKTRRACFVWLGGIMNNIQTVERKYQKGNMDQNAILNLLRKRGYRITKQRQNLLEIILEENCSSCKEIYIKAAKKDSGIGMATIYRMMNLLEELGALKWKNQYCICDIELSHLEVCKVVLEDKSCVELKGQSLKTVFEKGMEQCGYLEGKKVKQILVQGE